MFSNLIGNDEAKETLRRLLSSGRLPGSLLFTGEAGVGKKRFALSWRRRSTVAIARGSNLAMNARHANESRDPLFRRSGTMMRTKVRLVWSEHADVAMVRPYKQIIRVGPIRELEREANFRPFEGAARIFIIEDATT
jgi:DNA polymerase-3 subunit delta'